MRENQTFISIDQDILAVADRGNSGNLVLCGHRQIPDRISVAEYGQEEFTFPFHGGLLYYSESEEVALGNKKQHPGGSGSP